MRRGIAGADVVLLLAFGVAIGLAAATLIDRLDAEPRHSRFAQVYTAHAETTHTSPRVVTDDDVPFVLHELRYKAHGGLVRVEWYDGAVSPLAPDAGCYVTLLIDGRQVASSLFGGRTGENETRPGSLVWIGVLDAGDHAVRIEIDRADEGFAVPDARPDAPIIDGVLVTEWG